MSWRHQIQKIDFAGRQIRAEMNMDADYMYRFFLGDKVIPFCVVDKPLMEGDNITVVARSGDRVREGDETFDITEILSWALDIENPGWDPDDIATFR